ncbi:MAG TPA: PepSY domain-containing protein [Burkholderiales bacterium]|nr:PepSY domain-containing protein [Burkholderiales bacterium]
MTQTPGSYDAPAAGRAGSLYRVVWRWHFFAGLLVLPFLLLLAATGALYLFKDEIDHAVYREWQEVAVRGAALPMAQVLRKVQEQSGGAVLQFTRPAEPTRSIRMIVRLPDGEPRTAFADPHDGRLLGMTRYGGAMQVVRKLHSLQYFGRTASWLVEIAAGWTIILVGTGIFLWWPRGDRGGVVSVRRGPRERVFWRDVHAVTGIFAAAVIVFLAVTGMPWSDVWGGNVQEWSAVKGLGRPAPPADVVPEWMLEKTVKGGAHGGHHEAPRPEGPWALEKARAPESTGTSRTPITIDEAVAALDRAGLPKPYGVTLPQGARGAYAGTYSPARVEDMRIVYVDQFDARVLDDVGYARFGPVAKAIEWGIAVHQGQEYGWINRYVMLAGCIAIVIMAFAAMIMWWKRRPAGTLGVPPQPADPRVVRGLLAIVIPVAIFYPLVGASLLCAAVVDRAVVLFRRRAAAA